MWASFISQQPCWNLPARGTDELVPAARSIPKSVLLLLALREHPQRKPLPYDFSMEKVTRETNVKQST